MKTTKIILLVVALIVAAMVSNAQNNKNKSSSPTPSGGKVFGAGSNVVNIGIGFLGHSYYRYNKHGSYTYRASPAFNASFEHGLSKPVGPGFLGLGAYLGYQRSYFKFNDYYYNNNRYYYRHSWTHMLLAFRAVYHADALMTENAELYFGASAGLRFHTYRFDSDSNDPEIRRYELKDSRVNPAWSLFLGGRYFFTDNIGVFGELGYGMSWLTAGISLKF